MFQDVLALRGDLRLFYTSDKELSDAIYDIEEPLDALFKVLRRIVIDQKQEIENNKNWLQKSELSGIRIKRTKQVLFVYWLNPDSNWRLTFEVSMRVAVKNMSGVFIHSTTPRKARLLLKEKKAVIESKNPFTIRLLFHSSECGMKDSNSSNKNTSGLLLPEKGNTMCEYRPYKNNSKTHLIFGATGCGKTTLFKQLIQEKLYRNEDVFVLGNEIYGRLYFNDKSNNKLHFYSPKDVSSFSSKVDPKNLAEYIVNFCYSVVGKDNTRTIAIDGFEQFELNPDYSTSEYFRELAKECRTNNINFLYVLRPSMENKNESIYYDLPEIYERFSDIITVIK